MDIEKLNDSQKEAVKKTEGPVMILAGAGSGKTRTLVSRIAWLVDELQVPSHEILGVTFSNKAAREMRERVMKQVGSPDLVPQITTFHSFCARLLRNEAEHLGLSKNFTIYDESESKAIASSILANKGLAPKEISPYALLFYIEELKNNGFYHGRKCHVWEPTAGESSFTRYIQDELYPFFIEYEGELHKSNALDFGGLITGVIQLFEKYPDVLQRYQKRFRYILVDEYQDTNRAQFDLIHQLAGGWGNVCVVGDEDQSIYSWRGADIRNILDFEKAWPKATVLKLEQNYRSSRTIISAAAGVIANNEMRKGKEMWTDNPSGEIVHVMECPTDKDESSLVSREIKKLFGQGVGPAQIALFYRNNSQSRMFEDALRRESIPYRIVAGIKFYERKEIKDLISYLCLVLNEKDSLALVRSINVPARGIGVTTLRKLEEESGRSRVSLWEVVEKTITGEVDIPELKLGRKTKTGLTSFVNLIREARIMDKDSQRPSIIYEKILHESGYLEELKSANDYESKARIENLEEFLNAIKQYELGMTTPTLVGFLENISLDSNISESKDAEDTGEQVSLMTVHGAKGLEFPYVFLVGAEENLFPSFKTLETGKLSAIEEERRLFYVAMTRAMKRLTITFSQMRMLFGRFQNNGPSRFVLEIPKKFCQWTNCERPGMSSYRAVDSYSNVDYSDEYSQRDPGDGLTGKGLISSVTVARPRLFGGRYPVGSRIRHAVFGEGVVLQTEGGGKEEKVLIRFRTGEQKRFMAEFAPITLLA